MQKPEQINNTDRSMNNVDVGAVKTLDHINNDSVFTNFSFC